MSVDETKRSLRKVLEKLSTEELEDLLAQDFFEHENEEPDVEYIAAILEVIDEREGDTPEKQAEVEAAWERFQNCIQERELEGPTADGAEEASRDHERSKKDRQAPQKRPVRALRYCAVAAAVVVLVCSSAYALGWNVFQALAQWTEETFSFFTAGQTEPVVEDDPFVNVRLAVAKASDILAVPTWAPEETEQVGEIDVAIRKDRTQIQGKYTTGEKEFTIRVVVHDVPPEEYSGTYQKDEEGKQEYEAGGVVHYLVENIDYASAMWTNGVVEGHIQGDLKLEELQDMIDSIYEKE